MKMKVGSWRFKRCCQVGIATSNNTCSGTPTVISTTRFYFGRECGFLTGYTFINDLFCFKIPQKGLNEIIIIS